MLSQHARAPAGAAKAVLPAGAHVQSAPLFLAQAVAGLAGGHHFPRPFDFIIQVVGGAQHDADAVLIQEAQFQRVRQVHLADGAQPLRLRLGKHGLQDGQLVLLGKLVKPSTA